jgi:amidohydrolase
MTETSVLEGVVDEAGSLLDDAVALRRRIHRHPELGLELPETQAAVVEALDGLPVVVTTGGTSSSVVAVLDGEHPGPTVLLRGDMDALPMPEDTGLDYASTVDGAMHACGHDAHVAMLAGAAHLLAAHRGDLRGRVVFMFQPGEEGHHGARHMLDEGLLAVAAEGGEPVSMAFAIHQTPVIPSGMIATRGRALLASADELHVTVTGRGGHASMPHHAVDPIPIACEIVMAIQAMITRRVDVFDPAVVTVSKIRAGTTSNVIPESAQLLGTIRTTSERTRTAVIDDLRRLADGIAAAHGAEATVDIGFGYPVTVNDDDAAAFALDTARLLLGEGAAVEMPSPVMGAEDWSYVLQQVPGAMAFLGTAPKGVSGPVAPNHSNRMVIDEDAMAAGIATYAGVALRWLAGAPSR